jgi:hypothetical protein
MMLRIIGVLVIVTFVSPASAADLRIPRKHVAVEKSPKPVHNKPDTRPLLERMPVLP